MKRASWIAGLLGFCCLLFVLFWKKIFGDWTAVTWSITGVGVALVALWSWADRERLEAAAGSRSVRYGSGALLLVVVALALGVAANILGHRYDKRWDVTSGKQFTLSEQSRKIATGLDKDVSILAFFPTDSPEEASFRRTLEGYRVLSDRIKPEFHDPWREPFLARQYEITSQYGTVVLLAGDSKKRLESKFDEEALTNALVQVTSGREHRVCFTTDHGEAGPDDDQDPAGLGYAVLKLEAQNYKVDKVSILKEGSVPSTCEVLVVAGPQVDLLPGERESVAKYLKEGGRVFILLEALKADATAADLARYGVKAGQDIVLEDNPQAQQFGLGRGSILIPPDQLDFHPVTNDLKAGLWFYLARSVGKVEAPPLGLDVQVLVRSSGQGWAETSLEGTSSPAPDQGKDLVGNVPIMVAVEVSDPAAIQVGSTDMRPSSASPAPVGLDADPAASEKADFGDDPATASASARKGRLVVVGDADFATNQLVVQLMNQDLFLNTIAWLCGEENQISIRANKASASTLAMSVPQGVIVWLLSLLVVPGISIGLAVGMWVRRRKL
jgi:hypothetical protein